MVYNLVKGNIMFEEVKILELAQQATDEGLKWFERYQDKKEEYYYQIAVEKHAYAEGLLRAYAILTGRRVGLYEIEKELSNY